MNPLNAGEDVMPSVEFIRPDKNFHKDPKTGWSCYPFMEGANANINGVHVVAIYPGQARGNHYHEKTDEILLMFSGEGEFHWEEDGKPRKKSVGGGPMLMRIPAGIPHAFRNTGDATVYLLAVREGEDDPTRPDIVRKVIVKV